LKKRLSVAIHAEGGAEIGFGHIRRCLTLAAAVRQQGREVFFLSNADPIVARQVAGMGFEIVAIKAELNPAKAIQQSRNQDAETIVVDSYKFQTEDFNALMQAWPLVVAIDDLAAIDLPVHMVINGSVGADRLAYRGLESTRFILGPQYVLLRPEFAECPRRNILSQVGRVLITVGGSDPHNLTPRLIEWTCSTLGAIGVDVIIGPLFDNVAEIEAARQQRIGSVDLHLDPDHIKSLMLSADLAISGGGQTTYELAATGTPTIAIKLADNQATNLKGLSENGTLIWVGSVDDVNLEAQIRCTLSELASDPCRRSKLSEQGRSLVDGRGAARTANAILDLARNC
jgi:UDP-2,4-diacetamido-2,4,6-trideoxy-beta-L-altropyranose hydrolase